MQPVDVWGYIPSAKNKAADLISKGCNVKDIPIILEGPEILRKPMKCWPNSPLKKFTLENEENNEELVRIVNAVTVEKQLIEVDKFNDWENCYV